MKPERIAALVVVLPLVLGSAAIAWYRHAATPGVGEPGVVVFNLTGVASTGVWTLDDVNGLNYWWKTFEPATLSVREGDTVLVNLRSADLLHRFYIPQFGVGPVDVEPGHMVSVRFTANRAGVFQYYCTALCGTCHFYMRGWVVVTAAGEEPITPPRIGCPLCLPDVGPRPVTEELVQIGSYLYRQKGCITCHGPEGHGGVVNPNSANSPVPPHDTTAQKLFLAGPEDADALLALIQRAPDLGAVEEDDDISRFPVVRTRYLNAKQIIRGGRYSAKADPAGPEPPLQMPAWQHLVEERDIDALLSYFISLYDWEAS